MKRHSHRRRRPTCPSRRGRKPRRGTRPSCTSDPTQASQRSTRKYLRLVERCYRRYYRAAVAFAQARGLSHADAEDAVQTGYLAVRAAAPRYDRRKRLIPWLRGILRITALNVRRRGRRFVLFGSVRDALPDKEDEVQVNVDGDRLRAVLALLPKDEVEFLRSVQDSALGLRELAAQLGVGYGALKMRLSRVRLALREVLRKAGCHSLQDVEELGQRLLVVPIVLPPVRPARRQPRPSCAQTRKKSV